MVRATSKNGATSKKNKTEGNSTILSAIKAFQSIDFRVPAFKKKANSLSRLNKHRKARSLISNPLNTINSLLKSRKSTNKKDLRRLTSVEQIPFVKLYRNKPRRNYTNKSTHLTTFKSRLIEYDTDEKNDNKNNTNKKYKSKNNKKAKRVERRKQLKQRVENNNNNNNNSINNNSINNNNNVDMNNSNRIIETPKHKQNKHKNKKNMSKLNTARQVQNDENNLTKLFKNDTFSLNPLEYTNNILTQNQKEKEIKDTKQDKLSFFTTNFKKRNKKNECKNMNEMHKNDIKNSNHYKKSNGKRSVSLMSENELKKQITKQLSLIKQKKSVHKQKLKLCSNAKFKFNNKKMKSNNRKNGKYIQKKIKKMSELAKTNQKKRRWRH